MSNAKTEAEKALRNLARDVAEEMGKRKADEANWARKDVFCGLVKRIAQIAYVASLNNPELAEDVDMIAEAMCDEGEEWWSIAGFFDDPANE